jgi:hypothetical protein
MVADAPGDIAIQFRLDAHDRFEDVESCLLSFAFSPERVTAPA